VDLKAAGPKAGPRSDLYNGFGDTLTVAFELALVPVIFAGIGHLLDRWLGTAPLLLIVWIALAVTGLGAKMYYRYTAQMQAHEAEGPWAR
jgi:F0F1-type ATP synthase assembly protein I